MQEMIREISENLFIFVSSINRSPHMPEKACKRAKYAHSEILVFIFYYGNRAHFIKMGENLHR